MPCLGRLSYRLRESFPLHYHYTPLSGSVKGLLFHLAQHYDWREERPWRRCLFSVWRQSCTIDKYGLTLFTPCCIICSDRHGAFIIFCMRDLPGDTDRLVNDHTAHSTVSCTRIHPPLPAPSQRKDASPKGFLLLLRPRAVLSVSNFLN